MTDAELSPLLIWMGDCVGVLAKPGVACDAAEPTQLDADDDAGTWGHPSDGLGKWTPAYALACRAALDQGGSCFAATQGMIRSSAGCKTAVGIRSLAMACS